MSLLLPLRLLQTVTAGIHVFLERRAALDRLRNFWDYSPYAALRGASGLRLLDHMVRKDGLAHAASFSRLLRGGGRGGPGRATGAAEWVVPHSWVVPQQLAEWRAADTATSAAEDAAGGSCAGSSAPLWIYKPATASCGAGIVVGNAQVGCTARGAARAAAPAPFPLTPEPEAWPEACPSIRAGHATCFLK